MLTKEQNELHEYIDDLSDEAYCQHPDDSWSNQLWDALENGVTTIGHLDFNADRKAELKALIEKCGGWIRFDKNNDEYFVTLDEWIKKRHIVEPTMCSIKGCDKTAPFSFKYALCADHLEELKLMLLSLPLEEKKEKLLHYLSLKIKFCGNGISKLADNIKSNPETLNLLRDEHEKLQGLLLQLMYVNQNHIENINSIFEQNLDYFI